MKRYIFFSLLAIALNSCITTSQIIESNDSYLGIDKIKFSFTSDALSEEKFGVFAVSQYFKLGSTYVYERKKNELPSISVNFQISTPIRPEEFDSVMFLVLDDEKIRLSSDKYTYKEFVSSSEQSSAETNEKSAEKKENESRTVIISGTNQLMNRSFIIPQNLWVPIANAERIRYRIYLGKDGYNARPIQSDIRKLKEFFSLAISKRDALNPPLREGEKKL
jgi:hypothetical protein